MKGSRRFSGGFTLLEVMVVAAIVAILAAIAYPSYVQHVTRASRNAAQSELVELAGMQERIYLSSDSYSTSLTANYTATSAGGLGKASGNTADGRYALSMTVTNGQSFVISATPRAGSTQIGDGILSVSSDGARTCSGTPQPTWCTTGVW